MLLNATEAGQGPPVVLLHGLFGQGSNLGMVQRGLVGAHRVLSLDLRNHGASPHDPAMTYDFMAADVLETLAARDALPAAGVGHSMGGKTAMRLALLHPEAVSRLVVADIAPVPYSHANRALIATLRALPLTPGLTRRQADAALAANVEDAGLRGFLLQNLLFSEPPRWRIGLAELAGAIGELEGWEPLPAEARYPGSTLFLAGDRSDFILPEYRPTIRALFPHARFATLKGAGHWMHADQPAAFTAAVAAFLAQDRAEGPAKG